MKDIFIPYVTYEGFDRDLFVDACCIVGLIGYVYFFEVLRFTFVLLLTIVYLLNIKLIPTR